MDQTQWPAGNITIHIALQWGQEEGFLQAGVVQAVSFRGTTYELKIMACGEELTAFRSLESDPVAPGDTVYLYISRAQGMRGEEMTALFREK